MLYVCLSISASVFPLFSTLFHSSSLSSTPLSPLGLAASALLPWLIRLASIYAKGAAVLMHVTRERARLWCLLLCCKQLQHVSPSLFHTPVPAPSPTVFVLARLSICKWCISGEKMLLMIYLHLALIYANVSLSPIV